MDEPEIKCPNCGTSIKLTESLAGPLIESTKKGFEEKLRAKDEVLSEKMQALKKEQAEVITARKELDAEIFRAVASEKEKIALEEKEKAKDIQNALSIIERNHPITLTRHYASKALLKESLVISLEEGSKINKNRKYCTDESLNVKPLPSLPESLKEKLTPVWKDAHIFLTPDGEVVVYP